MRTVVGLVVVCLSMGCSFIFVRPPPTDHQQLAYFDCVSSDAAPAVDVTNAVVEGLLAGIASVDNPDTYENERNPGLAAGFGIVGVVYAASAVYGFVNTSKCEGAKALLAERVLKTQAERDQLLQARAQGRAQPAGCQRDVDCKGTRVCANTVCVEPPAAPIAQPAPSAVSPAAVPPPDLPPLRGSAPAEPAPPSAPAPAKP
jgi:hypothetical protein